MRCSRSVVTGLAAATLLLNTGIAGYGLILLLTSNPIKHITGFKPLNNALRCRSKEASVVLERQKSPRKRRGCYSISRSHD